MKLFLLGMLAGIVLATVGFTGVFRVLDKGVDTVKTQSANLAR
jgi:hypothetical protein